MELVALARLDSVMDLVPVTACVTGLVTTRDRHMAAASNTVGAMVSRQNSAHGISSGCSNSDGHARDTAANTGDAVCLKDPGNVPRVAKWSRVAGLA